MRRAAYSVVRFIMEAGAKGCEVIVSGKLRAQVRVAELSRIRVRRKAFIAAAVTVGGRKAIRAGPERKAAKPFAVRAPSSVSGSRRTSRRVSGLGNGVAIPMRAAA